MPADNEQDPLDRWLNRQVQPLLPPPGTFELITKRARRRKIRKAVISVGSAVAAAAAVAVAVPLGMSLHLSTSTSADLSAGRATATRHHGSHTPLGTGTKDASATPSSAAPSSATGASPSGSTSGSTSNGISTPGYLPPNFAPFTVTWDSLSTGWVMGPAGTPGQCGAQQNSTICTSIAVTHDGGQTWSGVPAPTTGGPDAATGVSGLRFLNAKYGWAFGPELWATDNGGTSWHKVSTGTASVTDLETINGRAYALFGNCTPPADSTGDTVAHCQSYTLKTSVAGSGSWTTVGGIPANLSTGTGSYGSAGLQLAGATPSTAATGYLVAPDGTLYEGPLDGGAWHKASALPCLPGAASDNGLPSQALLVTAGTTSSGATRVALVCAPNRNDVVVYQSVNNGSSWAPESGVGTAGTSHVGNPRSLTALPDGTLILATEPSTSSAGGIYLLAPGATQWQAAGLSDPSGSADGFTYVGMTSPTQGVALGGSQGLHAIWMTTDGGKTWQVRPIQS